VETKVTSLAIIQLTAEEQVWLGADVQCPGFGFGQVVALTPKPGHVWICDGATFHEVPVEQLARGWEQEPFGVLPELKINWAEVYDDPDLL
jgi:hypothetical protein